MTRLTCPNTAFFGPPVAGHDLLTRTGTIHFRSSTTRNRACRPGLTGSAGIPTGWICVPTHGGIARLLVTWFELAAAGVLAFRRQVEHGRHQRR
ncbi:MAG: hypothetical protein ACRDQY_14520 [Pseudonocardiaceae bacterium]